MLDADSSETAQVAGSSRGPRRWHDPGHAPERLPRPQPLARHDRRHRAAPLARHRPRGGRRRRRGRLHGPVDGLPPRHVPTRRSGSPSSRRRSPASARRAATVAGARRSSPPRSSGWPPSAAATRRCGCSTCCTTRSPTSAGSPTRRASTATSTRAATSPSRATRRSSNGSVRRLPTIARWGFGEEDHRLLDAHEVTAIAGVRDALGGSFTPHCAAIHPARLVRGLADAVERRGVVVHERTTAVDVRSRRVVTAHGTVRAEHVVLATEGYTPTVAGRRRRHRADLLAHDGDGAAARRHLGADRARRSARRSPTTGT